MLWVGIWTLQVIVGVDADAPSCRYTDNVSSTDYSQQAHQFASFPEPDKKQFDDLDGASLLPQFSNVNTYNGVTFEAFTVSVRENP